MNRASRTVAMRPPPARWSPNSMRSRSRAEKPGSQRPRSSPRFTRDLDKAEELATKRPRFSYHTNGFVKKAGHNSVIADILDYNTFTTANYDVSSGTFTAPVAGYYRFDTHGFSPTSTPGTDTRTSVGFEVNGQGVATAGGQLSQVDSPLPSLSHVGHLAIGDKVNPFSFSTVDVTFGASSTSFDAYYFQGEYLGP